MEGSRKVWSAQDAKAKFSEVLDRVERGDEQVVTRHGRKIARIIPFTEEDQPGESLVDFLNRSPLRGANELNFDRVKLKLRIKGKRA